MTNRRFKLEINEIIPEEQRSSLYCYVDNDRDWITRNLAHACQKQPELITIFLDAVGLAMAGEPSALTNAKADEIAERMKLWLIDPEG